jgi:hypothetical protein
MALTQPFIESRFQSDDNARIKTLVDAIGGVGTHLRMAKPKTVSSDSRIPRRRAVN